MAPTQSARRVAVISDVHGNVAALHAVLADLERHEPDLVVFGGDLTWGPEPEETLAAVEALDVPGLFVRGNAERALLEPSTQPTEREQWLRERHSAAALAFLASFLPRVAVEVDGLGAVCFCHGSPRSDEELVTPETPPQRVAELTSEIPERILVTAHTHLQFDRSVGDVRSINAGSVGMPYEERRGAYWAVLGPDVHLLRTAYALDEAVERYRASGDPRAEEMIEILVDPPTRAEVIEHAERLVYSG